MKLKKGDLILILVVVAAVAVWFGKDLIWPDVTDKVAVIEVDGQLVETVSLDGGDWRREIPLALPEGNYVNIVATGKEIWVEDASCPDKVCVKTGKISRQGQSIVCLPNKTVIYVEGTDPDGLELDDVAY